MKVSYPLRLLYSMDSTLWNKNGRAPEPSLVTIKTLNDTFTFYINLLSSFHVCPDFAIMEGKLMD